MKELGLRDTGAVLWQLWQNGVVIGSGDLWLGCRGHRLPDSWQEDKEVLEGVPSSPGVLHALENSCLYEALGMEVRHKCQRWAWG